MRKLIIITAISTIMASSNTVFAAEKITCKVISISNEVVTMKCQKANKLKKGIKVKVNGALVEGC